MLAGEMKLSAASFASLALSLGLAAATTVGLAAALPACQHQPALDVAQNVDLNRFQGKWFEVAKLPRPTQLDCNGTTAFYTLKSDGTMSVVNECKIGSLTGSPRAVTMSAKVPDASVPAKLSLDFGGGFYGDYWILAVGDSYEYAVVGHPTREYLWILSRTPVLEASKLQAAIDLASSRQFDTSRLEYTTQQ